MGRKIWCCLILLFCVMTMGLTESHAFWGSSNKLLIPIDDFQNVLSPDLLLLGKGQAAVRPDWFSTSQGSRMETETLVYGQAGNDRVVEKLLIVRTYEIRGASSVIIPDLNFKDQAILGAGTQTLASKDFSYKLMVDQGMIEKNEMDIIRGRGFVMSGCYALKAYSGKLADFLQKSKSYILYLERMREGKSGAACAQSVRAEDPLFKELADRGDKYLGKLMGVKDRPKGASEKTAVQKEAGEKSVDKSDELERKLGTLKNLLDKGLITQEDYNKKKAQILEGF